MKRKLLYLASRVFWPTKDGHEVHILNYCRALNEKYGYTIDVYIFEKREAVEEALSGKPAFIRNIFWSEAISKLDILRNVLCKTALSKEHWATQSSLYFSQANCIKLEKLNAQEHYDVLFVDMVRLAPYIRAFSKTPDLTVLDMGDMLSKRYLRQISRVSKNSNVGGAYTDKIPKVIQAILKQKWLQVLILKIENKLMKHAEVFWAEQYDSVILVSTVETDELNQKLSKPKAITVRVGIDSPYFKQDLGVVKGSGLVSFVGDMYTSANIDTVGYIVADILPLCKRVKQVRFIGRYYDRLRDTCKQNAKVEFSGVVADLREAVKRTNVFLAPMAYGTGVKIKIVEAMAMGMPVVTNPTGAEGIPGINGVHWYVGNNEKEIAEYVDKLLSDPNHCDEMGRNAQQLADEIFSWDAATNAFAQAGL